MSSFFTSVLFGGVEYNSKLKSDSDHGSGFQGHKSTITI